MDKILTVSIFLIFSSGIVLADTFGTGENQFEIEFVDIAGDASSANGTSIGFGNSFLDPGGFRIGKFEVTNEQWNKFTNIYGTPTGWPYEAYLKSAYYTGDDVPTNWVSWLEAAQFVNWLNISTGHHEAYCFWGTEYIFGNWGPEEAAGGTNVFRHKDAFYFLPTEDEWVKAAYWNGTGLQEYATKAGESFHQGDGVSGTGWNYYDGGYALDPRGPWDVGSGSEELNGTFDMMGNVSEFMESPSCRWSYCDGRAKRGGGYGVEQEFRLCDRTEVWPSFEGIGIGFRVGSVPEPTTLLLLGLGAPILRGFRKNTA